MAQEQAQQPECDGRVEADDDNRRLEDFRLQAGFGGQSGLAHLKGRRYYDGRLRAGRTHEAIVMALHDEASRRKVRRSATNGIIYNVVKRLEQADPGAAAAWERRYEGSTEACFKAMLHAGLVALDAEDVCFVPIPSLRAHVKELARPEED